MRRLNKYTEEARQAIANAREEARRLRRRLVGPEHLLLGVLKLNDPLVESVFVALQTSTMRVSQTLGFVVGCGNRAILSEPSLNAAARSVLDRAEEEAATNGAKLVGVEYLLLGIVGESDSIATGVLASFGVESDSVREHLAALSDEGTEDAQISLKYQAMHETTPTLNQFGRDLTLAAITGELPPLIGREQELERVMQILSRRSKNNPVLIGPAGVGKTAIAEGLAQRIINGHIPENLRNCRVVTLDVGLLPVGTKFRGDFESRLKSIMQEIVNNPGIIIVIDELHLLVQAGVSEGSLDAANLFKPMLARGEFRCIGATTLDDYRKTIETDPALERRFQPVQVPETTALETLTILRGLRPHYEEFHQITITDEALWAAVKMSSRYIQNRFQPDKAIDLIDEAAARASVHLSVAPGDVYQLRDKILLAQREKNYSIAHKNFPRASELLRQEKVMRKELRQAENNWEKQQQQQAGAINSQHIAGIVAHWTGIPVTQITMEEGQRLLNLEQELHQRVIGQHEAVQAVAKAVRRSRTDIRDSRRPIGSFIFVGPTGVGKTELARAIAASLFGDENAMLKLDMSEFMESHLVSRLIGTPPGYTGYEQAGQLTEAVRRRPYSVVLFDEVEKAHPKVFDLLLQVLEDGRLTDAHGMTVDFRNTIIILTSNAGTGQLTYGSMAFTPRRQSEQERQSSQHERLRGQVIPAIRSLFRPELFNRIDDVVVFHALEQEHLHQIVDLMVSQTQERLTAQSIELHVSDTARQQLVKRGYHVEYGARQLRRTVQQELDDMLAEAILQGALTSDRVARVDASDGELSLQVLDPACEGVYVTSSNTDDHHAA